MAKRSALGELASNASEGRKKINPNGPKVSELTIGGGVVKPLFFFVVVFREIGMKISQNPSLPL